MAADLTVRKGPIAPVLKRLDSRITALDDISFSTQEFNDLYSFLSVALLDTNALPSNLANLIPKSLPSGRKVLTFQSSTAVTNNQSGTN